EANAVAAETELVLHVVGARHLQPILLVRRAGRAGLDGIQLDGIHRIDVLHAGDACELRHVTQVHLHREAVEQGLVGKFFLVVQTRTLGGAAKCRVLAGYLRRAGAVDRGRARELHEPNLWRLADQGGELRWVTRSQGRLSRERWDGNGKEDAK